MNNEESCQCNELKILCDKYKNKCVELQKLCDKYQQENVKLCKTVFDDNFLVDDNVKTKYYTGLPSYELMQVVFSFVIIGLLESFYNGPCI